MAAVLTSCNIDGCDNTLKPGSKLKTCKNCRAGMDYWLRRKPADVIKYREKLHVRDQRMENLVDRRLDKRRRGYK